jgi:hypothetical protein
MMGAAGSIFFLRFYCDKNHSWNEKRVFVIKQYFLYNINEDFMSKMGGPFT